MGRIFSDAETIADDTLRAIFDGATEVAASRDGGTAGPAWACVSASVPLLQYTPFPRCSSYIPPLVQQHQRTIQCLSCACVDMTSPEKRHCGPRVQPGSTASLVSSPADGVSLTLSPAFTDAPLSFSTSLQHCSQPLWQVTFSK
ncbi:hypothetical protein Pmani_003830 [Petrolisthes manimaculis]|uniref:Uncharacterized protein n=1 Tax=Petrolisthes manimaculis TaxID=1843537 RepID=A0AAE1QI18_9EUCA|nr:hypothetical protein Pmani_003830 [Petrolisthes manimaculis]